LNDPWGIGTHCFAKALYSYFTDAPFDLKDKDILQKTAATFQDGLQLQNILEGVRKSSEQKEWVTIASTPPTTTKLKLNQPNFVQ